MLRIWLLSLLSLSCCAGDLPFHSLTLAEAQQEAVANDKLIFLAFYRAASGPAQVKGHRFLRDAKARNWLQTQTYALLIDADAQPELVERYQIRVFPGFILLDAHGQVLYRYLSSCSAKQFLEDSGNAGVPGQLERIAREKLAAHPGDPALRYDLATKLLYGQKLEESVRLVEAVLLEKREGKHDQFPSFRLYLHLQACKLPAATDLLEGEYQYLSKRVLAGQFDRALLEDLRLLAPMTGHPISSLYKRLHAANLPPKKVALFEEVFAEELGGHSR